MASVGLLSSDVVLAERYDVALLDLDGVVYLGSDAVDGAVSALARAREYGMRLAFVTNNAARPPEAVAGHLAELGIPAEAAEVITSAQVAAHYVAQRVPAGSRVLVVGTVGLVEALSERGLIPVEHDEEGVAAIVQGFSPDLTWRQLAQGAIAINRGALWVATNLDPTVPSPAGRLPGNGSLVAALRHATGATPIATGKPDPSMHRESVERSRAERPIVVGDRLDADIEGANAVGCPSLLVFSGVTSPADVLAAPPRLRPSYLAEDVSGLVSRHARPVVTDDRVECGRWSVRPNEGTEGRGAGSARTLTLAQRDQAKGAGGRPVPKPTSPAGPVERDGKLDALRALCVATWQHEGEHRYTPADEASREVLASLGLC